MYAARAAGFGFDEEDEEEAADPGAPGPNWSRCPRRNWRAREEAERLLERSRGMLGKMHPEDVEEAVGLHERIAGAMAARDSAELETASAGLRELLFFLEGQ